MSTARRIAPEAPGRRGWCPGLARPMPTGDGLLARIHPPLGRLTAAQVRAVAEAAARFGNGHVDVTARANLQLRGVTEATRGGLVAALEAAGLGDARADGGPQRLTLTSPHAGLAPALLDVCTLARAIEAAGLAVPGLPAKTLVVIEGGGATDLPGIAADLHVRAVGPDRAAIGLAEGDGVGWLAAIPASAVPGTVAVLLRAFAASGRRRIRDLAPDERRALVSAPPVLGREVEPPSDGLTDPRTADRRHPGACERGARPDRRQVRSAERERGPVGDAALAADAPFGRCTPAMLHRLADVADALGTDAVRVSPTRGFVLPVCATQASGSLAELARAGFVTRPDDPRRAVAACPGAPACASGSTATGADAARLADAFRPFAERGLIAHVSGCAKGCAHPGRADLTLVARAGRYGIVLDGTAADTPAPELTFEAALERVRRARAGSLAEAFGMPARQPRLDTDIGIPT